MGWRTWPGYELFGNNCLECFPVDETPKKIVAYFSGIELTDTQHPDEPGPPRSSWALEQDVDNPCFWWQDDPPHWGCGYYAKDNGDSRIALWYGAFSYFASVIEETCITAFANQNLDIGPPISGINGDAQVFWRPESSSPSVRGIMKKINMEPHRNTMFEGFPLDATYAVAKFCRTRDATNVKIKFEI